MSRKSPSQIRYFLIFILLLVMPLAVIEGDVIKNTIGGERLFWFSGICGLSIAAGCAFLLNRQYKGIYEDKTVRGSIITSLFMIGFLLCPLVVSFINRLAAKPATDCRVYTLISKSTGGSRYTEYCLFIEVNNKTERFTVHKEIYDSLTAPGDILLCTQIGALGYEVVKEFRSAN